MSNVGVNRITFHKIQTSPSIGYEESISLGASTVNIITTGTTTSFEAKFEGKQCDIWSPIMAVTLNDLKLVNSATIKEIIYQLDLTGLEAIRCNLTSITGGNISIYGFSVN